MELKWFRLDQVSTQWKSKSMDSVMHTQETSIYVNYRQTNNI